MSQEPRHSQPPSSPKPEAQQVTQPLRNSFQLGLKAQSLKLLRGTIRLLEGVVVKLETEPATTTPSWVDKLQAGWNAILATIRSFLPENLSSKFSDTALTGIVAGIAIILIWTTSLLSDQPAAVALTPPESEQLTEVTSQPKPEQLPSAAVIPPEFEQPIEVVTVPPESEQPPAIAPPEFEQPIEVVADPSPELVANSTVPTPPELAAPAEPQPVEVIPSPKQTVELTPEQSLVVAIEKQVAEISDRFADGLISSIQVNFEGSRLKLKVANDWYTLQPSQQDNLAARMLEHSKELDFSRLDITDSQGTLVARSPVLGKDMVILKRQMLPNPMVGS